MQALECLDQKIIQGEVNALRPCKLKALLLWGSSCIAWLSQASLASMLLKSQPELLGYNFNNYSNHTSSTHTTILKLVKISLVYTHQVISKLMPN